MAKPPNDRQKALLRPALEAIIDFGHPGPRDRLEFCGAAVKFLRIQLGRLIRDIRRKIAGDEVSPTFSLWPGPGPVRATRSELTIVRKGA